MGSQLSPHSAHMGKLVGYSRPTEAAGRSGQDATRSSLNTFYQAPALASGNPSQSWRVSHASTWLEQSAQSTHDAAREPNGEYKKNPDDRQDYYRMERHE